MTLRYDIPSDVNMRLHNTICRFKGKPVLVQHREETLMVNLHCTDTKKILFRDVHSSDADLDISSPPLGLTNHGQVSIFISRYPHRRQKQGLDISALHFSPLSGLSATTPNMQNIASTISGDYPSFDSVLKNMHSDSYRSCAWDRHFAFGYLNNNKKNYVVYHRTHPIGVYNVKTEQAILTSVNDNLPVVAKLSEYMHVKVQENDYL